MSDSPGARGPLLDRRALRRAGGALAVGASAVGGAAALGSLVTAATAPRGVATEDLRIGYLPITDATPLLVDSLVSQLAALLEDLPGESAAATHRQLALVNELLVWLRQRLTPGTAPGAGSGPVDRHVDRMLAETHSAFAPWTVVATDKKKKARLNILRHVLRRMNAPGIEAAPPDPDVVFSGDDAAGRTAP